MISHRSQSNCYLVLLLLLNYARREARLVFFSRSQLNCSNAYIRTITSEQLSTERCYEAIVISLNRQMLTEIFIEI